MNKKKGLDFTWLLHPILLFKFIILWIENKRLRMLKKFVRDL
jgi:hypothetical protein